MTTIFKILLVIATLLLVEGCTVQYSTEHPMANNPRYKDEYSRIKQRRVQSPELVINGRKQPVHGAQNHSNRKTEAVLDPNSPKAMTFGRKATVSELAQAQGISGAGGIRFGEIVLIPPAEVWDRPLANRRNLHIKSIRNGETIARAHHGRSEVRIPLVQGQLLTAKMFTSYDTNCKVLLDDTGEPVAIREAETGFNRYGFFNFLNRNYTQYHAHEKKVKSWESILAKEERNLSILKNQLAKNRAYQNGQCVAVKQRSIPKAPKRIDPKLIELNAHGHCVNLMGSNFTQEKVIEALEAAGRNDITQNFQRWALSNKKMSCAVGVTVPKSEIVKTRFFDEFFAGIAKDFFRDNLRTDLFSCISKVERRCDDGYNDWERERSRIINEPEKLLAQCKADTLRLKNYNYTALNNAKAQLAKATVLRDAALKKKNSVDEKTVIPFTDRRAYCGQ